MRSRKQRLSPWLSQAIYYSKYSPIRTLYGAHPLASPADTTTSRGEGSR